MLTNLLHGPVMPPDGVFRESRHKMLDEDFNPLAVPPHRPEITEAMVKRQIVERMALCTFRSSGGPRPRRCMRNHALRPTRGWSRYRW